MSAKSEKVFSRIASGLKKFQPILEQAKKRDVNESDTVTIVTDILSEVLGYDKFGEITSEHAIRGTFCDIAIKIDGAIAVLIEAKAIGLDLKDNHIKQAVDYAANQGCDWVGLTNGMLWQLYQVSFSKPIQAELILELDLLSLNHRKDSDVELFALVSREAWQKSRLEDYANQKHALSRFTIAAVAMSDPCLQVIRRELRRISRDIRIDVEDIEKVLSQEVIKREVLEGEKADSARRIVSRAARKALRASEKSELPPAPVSVPQTSGGQKDPEKSA